MLFNSLQFMFFFPIVLLIYFVIPKKIRYIWLFVASYYFYMCWNVKYVVLIAECTFVTWISGIILEKYSDTEKHGMLRKVIVAFNFVVTLGNLVFFKYFQFIWDNIAWIGKRTGFQWERSFDIVLPVGISFYTFQALSYIVDVYQKRTKVEHNPFRYALFVSFFPQLVAGPIERSENLLRQLREIEQIKVWNSRRICNGFVYMLYGFFMKLVLADNLSLLADEVFKNYRAYGSVELFLGAIAFTLQIYCDFSSYSSIAIGAAEVMGFELMENFHAPYFATSIQDFWRRWHISLSTWFRDYVYIPLGGNRCSKLKQYRNLMITFLLSGLWHGANWTYIVWGGIHGIYQIIEKESKPIKERVYPRIGIVVGSVSHKVGQICVTFFLTMIAWIFFRADSLRAAITYIAHMFTRWNLWVLTDGTIDYFVFKNPREWATLWVNLGILFVVDLILERKNCRIDKFLEQEGNFCRILISAVLIIIVAIVGRYGGGYDANAFIYFQF